MITPFSPAGMRLAILKPNHENYSETFIEHQINRLSGKKQVLYGGFFPTHTPEGRYLIRNLIHLARYWIEKNWFKRENIPLRTGYLARYFIREKISLVLAHYGVSGALVWSACQEAKVPLVIHFHGFDAHEKRTLDHYRQGYLNAFDYASAIVVVSHEMETSLVALGAPQEKIHHIPYGVDLDFFIRQDPAVSDLRFLSVARFAEKKAPLSTIHAFHQLWQKFPAARLVMAGTGPLLEEAKVLVGRLGLEQHVEFLGVRSPNQVRDEMKIARAFVQHSVTAPSGDKEGTPNSILEACSSALPVVSTYHAGIPEAVVHDVTGFLVQEHDISTMARYMIVLAEQPALAQKMGLKGRDYMKAHYDAATQARSIDNILFQSFCKYYNLHE